MLEKIYGIKGGKQIFITGIIFFFSFILLLFFGKANSKIKNIKTINYNEKINKLFENINDNYTLDISLFKNEEKYTLWYSKDKNITLYSSDSFSKLGYVFYNNQFYYLEDNKIHKLDNLDINTIFNEKLYDINFIKHLISKCTLKNKSLIKKECEINTKDYINIYNEYYNEAISLEENDIEIEIIHDNNKIIGIIIDYDNIFIDELKYTIDIEDVNKNNFSEYEKLFQKF